MKKAVVFGIKRFATHDGDGVRTTVFFKGCPLRCVWCHNPEGISREPQLAFYAHRCVGCAACAGVCKNAAQRFEEGSHRFERALCVGCGACASVCPSGALRLFGHEADADELLELLLEDRDFYEASGGGVTLSGGECLLQADFCAGLLRRLKQNGINTAVDTCGFVPREAFDKVIPYTDVFLYDIKAVDSDVHRRCTGQDCRIILDNLLYLDKKGLRTEIRIPLVPGYNDGQLEKIRDFLSGLKHVSGVKVLPYHDNAHSKYNALGMTDTLPPKLPGGSVR